MVIKNLIAIKLEWYKKFSVKVLGHEGSPGDHPHPGRATVQVKETVLNLHFFIRCGTYNSQLHTTKSTLEITR
jgi:hypothetical protein